MLWLGTTALVLLYLITAWAMVTGTFKSVAAHQPRRVMTTEWALILGSVVFAAGGALLVLLPGAGALSLT